MLMLRLCYVYVTYMLRRVFGEDTGNNEIQNMPTDTNRKKSTGKIQKQLTNISADADRYIPPIQIMLTFSV